MRRMSPTIWSRTTFISPIAGVLIAALLLQAYWWAAHTHPIDSIGEHSFVEQTEQLSISATEANPGQLATDQAQENIDDCDHCLRDGQAVYNGFPDVADTSPLFAVLNAPFLARRHLSPWMSAHARGPPSITTQKLNS